MDRFWIILISLWAVGLWCFFLGWQMKAARDEMRRLKELRAALKGKTDA